MENLPALAPEAPPLPAALPMPVQIDQVLARVHAVQEIVARVFREGVHFGVIPGTGDRKTLLKPGFDALCLAFQFAPSFEKRPESIERDDFVSIVYRCTLAHIPTGRLIATGEGACNSREEKYRWAQARRACPGCGAEGTIIRGKEEFGGGWLCYARKGGCGAKFKDGEVPAGGRVENDNPWSLYNTLLKMAQKRAGMAAIITACGLSGEFTQDLEDFAEDAASKPAPAAAPDPELGARVAACKEVADLTRLKTELQQAGRLNAEALRQLEARYHTITGGKG